MCRVLVFFVMVSFLSGTLTAIIGTFCPQGGFMELPDWIEGFPGSITVCDPNGMILYMNEHSLESFSAEGGSALIGTNLLDCHPEPARSKLLDLLKNRQANVYTIEKKGAKKLIYQAPWFQDGKFAGLVELSLVIPFEMPHFIRQG